jgi:hypothetical protein
VATDKSSRSRYQYSPRRPSLRGVAHSPGNLLRMHSA